MIKTLGEKCVELYPDRIPIIVFYGNNITNTNSTSSTKKHFLVDKNTNIGYLCTIFSKNIRKKSDKSLKIFINNIAIQNTEIVNDLYAVYKDKIDDCIHMILDY